MPKFSQGTVALAALIAFALWSFVVLPLLYYPRYEAPNYHNRSVHGETQSGSTEPSLILYKVFTQTGRNEISRYCTNDSQQEQHDWAHKYICDVRISDVYIAVFTGLLALVTIGLIIVGFFTIRQMVFTERRQLRA